MVAACAQVNGVRVAAIASAANIFFKIILWSDRNFWERVTAVSFSIRNEYRNCQRARSMPGGNISGKTTT
jgi:hypothetical protein